MQGNLSRVGLSVTLEAMSPDETEPGHRFQRQIPQGDDRQRLVCADCGFVNYENPRIVVGVVATWQDKILLCQRAINPRQGFWTLPAGYLELQESAEAGARREAFEEARADITLDQLLAVYSVPRLSQIQLIYRAALTSPSIACGPESLAVALYGWDEIPWASLAFPSVAWALQDHRDLRGQATFAPRHNPPGALGAMSELEAVQESTGPVSNRSLPFRP